MTEMKLTKLQKVAIAIESISKVELENKAIILEYLEHEKELLNRPKSSGKKAEEKKAENASLERALLETLAEIGKPVTVSEIMKLATNEIALLSNQKITYLLRMLLEQAKVVKVVEKKVPRYSLAE